MDKPTRQPPAAAGHDPAAAGRGSLPSSGRLAIVLLIAVAGVAGLWWLFAPSQSATPARSADVLAQAAPAAPSPGTAAGTMPPSPPQAPAPDPERDADPTRDLSSYVARGENPTVAQVIEKLHERGIHSGLGAFNPPGTSPPLVGLAVPENFPLPKGYVRHHQTTDDGQPIEAILMFAPDYQPRDANNQPIRVPDNRVVPPELAPPGLPVRSITIPNPATGSTSGR